MLTRNELYDLADKIVNKNWVYNIAGRFIANPPGLELVLEQSEGGKGCLLRIKDTSSKDEQEILIREEDVLKIAARNREAQILDWPLLKVFRKLQKQLVDDPRELLEKQTEDFFLSKLGVKREEGN